MPYRKIVELVPLILDIIEYRELGLRPIDILALTGLAHTTGYRYCGKADEIRLKLSRTTSASSAVKARLVAGKPFWIWKDKHRKKPVEMMAETI